MPGGRRRAKLEFRGQPYGSRTDQAAVNATGDAAAGNGVGGVGNGGLETMLDALAAEDPTPVPTTTARPGQPITSGLPVGAGPGPEVLPARAQNPAGPSANRADVEMFAPHLPTLEILANTPGASREMQIFYRRLRSQMPFDVQTVPSGGR